MCARRRSNFLLPRQEKVTKEKATLQAASLRFAAGNLRCSVLSGSRETRAASRHSNRREPSSAKTCAPRRILKGTRKRTSIRAIAALGPQRARPARPKHPAERSDGPKGCWLPTPSGCVWGAQGAGWRVCRRTYPLRQLTRRGCLNGAPQARSEFHGAPRTRAPQVALARSAGVADSRVAFSLVIFFWRSKRKLLARRATPGLRPQPRHEPRPAQGLDKLNPNGWKNSQTIKTIATSA